MKKFISLILSIAVLCSVFIGTGAIANAAYEPVEVTLTSQQGAFEDITKTYAKGEVFEMTVMWQSENPLCNIELYTYLNSKGLKVISEEINKTKITSQILTNISESLQQKHGEVIFTFSIVKGCDFTTEDYMVTYQVEVLETASAQETLTLNCKEAFATDSQDNSVSICYIKDCTINEETKESFSMSAKLSEPAEVPTQPTTEPGTDPSSETNPSSEPESSSVTESSSETESTSATEASSDNGETNATDPSETVDNTTDTTATDPSNSDNTNPTNPSESTDPSATETDPTEAHVHSWNDGTVTKEANCTEEGEMTYACSGCDETKTEAIPATGHTEKTVNAKKATYFAKGYTGDTICEVCEVTIEKGKAIKALKLKKPTVSYKGAKGKFTVKYTKVKDAKGFEVKYKLGKKTFTKTFKAKKNVSKIVNKLKKGNYKDQVRAYTKKGKNMAYSKWTKKTTVKVK